MKNPTTPAILKDLAKPLDGKRSVGPLKPPVQPTPSLTQEASNLAKGITDNKDQYTEYDFCHHCKQLKNKQLLVPCKYSSKLYRQANH